MKKPAFLLLFAAVIALCGCTKTYNDASVPYTIKDGKIYLEAPARAAGQQSALQMTCDPIETVKVAFVGVGGRGAAAVRRFTRLEGVKIIAFCDENPARVEKCQGILEKAGLPKAAEYVGSEAYKDLCKNEDVDLVYIATDWLDHVPVALCAMENGHHAAIEVPSAMTIKDCWDLVDMSERTRLHCSILENCCYDFFEMATLNMAQQGLFGEVYHAEGAYIHYLAEDWDHSEVWRIDYNMTHRGDNYPTHGFGPVC